MSMQNSKASVLIVEDEPDISEVIRYNLSRAGYRVRNTLDGEEGLIMIKEEKPDVIIVNKMKIFGEEKYIKRTNAHSKKFLKI